MFAPPSPKSPIASPADSSGGHDTANRGGSVARPAAGPRLVSKIVFVDTVRFADIAAILVTGLLTVAVYLTGIHQIAREVWPRHYSGAILVASGLTAISLHLAGIYDYEKIRHPWHQAGRAIGAWLGALAVLLLLAFLAKIPADFSRIWFVLWFAAGALALTGVRFGACRVMRAWQQSGRLRNAVAIVGAGPEGARIVERLKAEDNADVDIVGVFDDRKSRVAPVVADIPVKGTVDDLLAMGQEGAVDQVIIALPVAAEERISAITRVLRQLPANIELGLDLNPRDFPGARPVQLGSTPVLRLVGRPLSDWHAVIKFAEDRILGLLILGLASPVMLGIAAAIKLHDGGPVLFRQRRFGFNNKEIVVYKFRTMYQDMGDRSGAAQTVRNDPRITPVGGFLRRTNLDELPQFINVLQGRLSVVGPRPHALTMRAADRLYHEAVADYAVRHRVKPGVTGWAQVNGLRGETDTMEKATRRVVHDLHYIDNWSLLFDLRIILLTVVRSFSDPNAY